MQPADWPLILGGPIVRRVEPRLASVWVALKAPRTVRLDIWQGIESADVTRAPLASGTARTVRVGDNLHVVVVIVQLPSNATPLLPGLIYAYNLTFISDAGGVTNLKLENLLVDKPGREVGGVLIDWPHLALGYATNLLPTFVLPPAQLEQLKIVHGSCRRAGCDTPDALAWVDDFIRTGRVDPIQRPHQLILSGDQIYADDMPDALQLMATDVGNKLIGTTEFVPTRWPLPPGDQGTRQWPVDQVHFPAGLRKNAIMADARFTTVDGESHIISFGEFLALYLMHWSNVLWPERMPDFTAMYAAPAQVGAPDMSIWSLHTGLGTKVGEDGVMKYCSGAARKRLKDAPLTPEHVLEVMRCVCAHKRPGFRRNEQVLRNFRGDLPKVRRALANVATYMMFDDHEVTDDWYFSLAWRDQVTTSPLGRTIVRNALLAYGVCQGWGNDPLKFMADVVDPQTNQPKPGPQKQLLLRLPELFPSGDVLPPNKDVAAELETLLGLDNVEPPLKWHYSVPGPRHQLVVMDCRTRRTFASRTSAPGNASPQALADQIPAGPLPAGIDVVVVVSSLTVLGTPIIDELVGPSLYRLFDLKDHGNKGGMPGTDPDAIEAWPYEPRVLEALLKKLEPLRRVVILSGDVHWGYSSALSYWKKGDSVPARFAQFTSSAMRNLVRAEIRVASRQLGFLQHVIRARIGIARLGYNTAQADLLVVPPGQRPRPALRERLRRSPALLPTVGWPTGTVENPLRPPDWAWRMDIPVDTRPEAQRPEPVRPESLVPGDPNADIVANRDGYKRAAVRHVKQLRDFNFTRQLLFASNLGIVTFRRPTPTTLEVAQDLMAVHPDSAVQGRAEVFTRHVIPLTVPAEERPHIGAPP